MLKRLNYLLLIFSIATSCTNGDKKNVPLKSKPTNILKASEMKVDKMNLSTVKAIFKTVHGNVTIKFFPKQAPNTVTRIAKLIQDGFYNGLQFHRVIPNFVVQTGDPTNTGSGGSGQKIKAEFNSIQHTKGIVAMARGRNPDSADSQFYIALNTLPHLDNQYTVFGKVVEGLETIDKISQGDKIISVTIADEE